MKLNTAAVICALAAAASPAVASNDGFLRKLGNTESGCDFYDFEGLWEGVDPDTGATHTTSFSCENGSAVFGKFCDIETVINYHSVCLGTKTVLTGRVNYGDYGQFEGCSTEGVCLMPVSCPELSATISVSLPAVYTQDELTKRVNACVDLPNSDEDDPCEAFEVTLNKVGGGWRS
mmetsp:Transcript_11037/g.22530  ORF Transcript_11037/g.22530 Transcript_11037/m.22530 type:complete len:176 (+) Transcript_11037:508-1035(+)